MKLFQKKLLRILVIGCLLLGSLGLYTMDMNKVDAIRRKQIREQMAKYEGMEDHEIYEDLKKTMHLFEEVCNRREAIGWEHEVFHSNEYDTKQRKQFLLACRNGEIEEVAQFLDGGANPNGLSGWGYEDHENVTIHRRRELEWPLFEAVYGNHLGVVKLLVERGADINYRLEAWYDFSNVLRNYTDTLASEGKYLVNVLGEKAVRFEQGVTILHVAAFFERREIIAWLLEQGIDIKLDNNNKDWIDYLGIQWYNPYKARAKMAKWLVGVRGLRETMPNKHGVINSYNIFAELNDDFFKNCEEWWAVHSRFSREFRNLDERFEDLSNEYRRRQLEVIKKHFDSEKNTMSLKHRMIIELFKIYEKHKCYEREDNPISDEYLTYCLEHIIFNKRFFTDPDFALARDFVIKHRIKDVLGRSILEEAVCYCPDELQDAIIAKILFENETYRNIFLFKAYIEESQVEDTYKKAILNSINFGIKNVGRWLWMKVSNKKVRDYVKVKNEYISALHLAKKLYEPKAFNLLANDSLINDSLFEAFPRELALHILEFAGPKTVDSKMVFGQTYSKNNVE